MAQKPGEKAHFRLKKSLNPALLIPDPLTG
jgi:hypothetical protein